MWIKILGFFTSLDMQVVMGASVGLLLWLVGLLGGKVKRSRQSHKVDAKDTRDMMAIAKELEGKSHEEIASDLINHFS